ncbi:MAG: hypothetical protein IT578_10890 [Verrucomicrobiae bacterium]|nr:hypothetical protein [Verrucomicrobiae bacterium]
MRRFLPWVFCAACAGALRGAETPAFAELSFAGLSPELQLAARRVIVATGARFDRAFGTDVGRRPISVRFAPLAKVASEGEDVAGATGRCRVRNGRAEILVAADAPEALGAILAHEATHAFVAEAFGEIRDPYLGEGLAQEFAAQAWPPLRNELRHLWLKGGPGAAASPYIAGFHWIEEHAGEARFGEFVRTSGAAVSRNLEELERRWREFLKKKE